MPSEDLPELLLLLCPGLAVAMHCMAANGLSTRHLHTPGVFQMIQSGDQEHDLCGTMSCSLLAPHAMAWMHLQDGHRALQLVLPFVNSKLSLARCSFVSQHVMGILQTSIQQRFQELLPAFLQADWDGIGTSRSIREPYAKGGLGALQWFCSCAGPERMGTAETALTVLTSSCYPALHRRVQQDRLWILAEAGECSRALQTCSSMVAPRNVSTCRLQSLPVVTGYAY
jgi:hypothetical protein